MGTNADETRSWMELERSMVNKIPQPSSQVNFVNKEYDDGGGSGGGGEGTIVVDSTLSTTSKNPVQNKVITTTLSGKASITAIPTKTSALINDSGFINGIDGSDVTAALGYTPYNSTNPSNYQTNVLETVVINGTAAIPVSKTIYISVPVTATDIGALPSSTTLGDLATDEQLNVLNSGVSAETIGQVQSNESEITTIKSTLTTYGNIVTHNVNEFATSAQGQLASSALQPGDKISKLNNDRGYINGINYADVTTALGYTPYSASNPSGYINGISGSDVTTALGYTPYSSANPSNYQENVLETITVNGTAAVPLDKTVNISIPSSATWGNIDGTLSNQIDLQSAFDLKGDNLYYDEEESKLYLMRGDTPISEGIVISGGGSYTTITLTNKLDSDTLYVATGKPAVLSYLYENSDDLDATVTYKVNNVDKYTSRISSGDITSFDIAQYLDNGYNYVQVQVTDLNNTKKSLIYIVNTVTLSISSTFDASTVYTSDVTFRYTPVGELTKTIHFEVDGTELQTETIDTSGRQQSKILTFNDGVHTLRVWASATLNEETVTSNILIYEVMYSTGASVLIASDFRRTDFTEGETVNIPLIVYDPNSLTTDVEVRVNNVVVSELNVGRTQFNWSHVLTETGTVVITVIAGASTRTFTLTVAESGMDVEPVTENLELYLTANGRSNSDINRSVWGYESISCTLSNFNFVTNGWIDGALKISNGASVTIPFQIFAEDFRMSGKTIEIEFSTSNVLSYSAIVASCMSGGRGFQIGAQSAVFKSEQSEVDVKFKEDERIRLGFVVEDRSANRLIYTYLNGIISGVTQYPVDDDFSQITPVNITLGSNSCDLNIYNIRVYDMALTHYDMLDNFIADMGDIQRKLSLYTANNIFDSYGNVLYNKLINQIPIMTITGDLPASKGDKKTVDISYEDQADNTRDFSMSGVTIDVQGTSSQYYPKKNYKISKLPVAYSLRPGAPGEKVFTMKADYMESSHAHNTGLARLVNDLYSIKVPPQVDNSKVRTTIDGFPIAIFYRVDSNTQPSYFGVYNFNNDKSSDNTFGFTEGCESWEFCNNTSNRCLFLSDDFTDSEAVLTDFEARYPKDYTNFSKLEDLVTWVYGCYSDRATTGVDTFKDECDEHFNVDFLLTYYIVSEFFGMVDSRAKNMFLNYYADDELWYPVFYDLDTAIGLNNEGVNDFNFDIETHDVIGSKNVFNGENSGLWYLVEHAYADELNELYNSLRNSGRLTYEKVMKYLNEDQIAKICEAQYNADAEFKYISPLVDEGIATYLYTAQGSRIDHIKWWIYNRFNYLDSKYTASDFKSNYLTMRLYTPAQWQEVEPNAEIKVVPYADQYVRVKYGSYNVYERGHAGVQTTITPPAITFNDTETILYGASRITSIGDLSPLYAGTIDVSKAIKLTTLKIGHGGDYSNTNLNEITLGNNTLLQDLDVRNCPNLSGALDVSGCTGIKEIYATGTSLTSVKLPDAGAITDLELPTTITNLTIKNQNNITNFVCGSNVSTLILENTNLDAKALFLGNPVTKVRITGIDWTLDNFDILDSIYDLVGSDENGNNLPHGVLAGTIRMSTAKESVVNEYKKKFVGLTFIVGTWADEDYICTDFGQAITTNDGKVFLYTL